MIKKTLLAITTGLLLTACGSDSDSGNSPEIKIDKPITISGISTTKEIFETDTIDLTISGSGHVITVKSGTSVDEMIVSGLNNLITVEAGASVSSLQLSGSNNMIVLPTGASVSQNDTGLGNTVTYQKNNLQSIIVGTWNFTYEDTQCTESYTFEADDNFNMTSLDEVASGHYSVTGDSVALNITADNGMSDCLGDTFDDTGKLFELLVEIHSNDSMTWTNEYEYTATLTRQP
ncbi:MAG: hypothetical protein HRU20_30165 [Pseudomonadales bacterium]|nr:hypothetical protein [Pseudomonadales bacterium]